MTSIDALVAHGEATLGDVRIHYVEAGQGPLVILLHGFPDFWYTWRNQIPALAAAGFRVVAPDMRGYNQSSKPRGVVAYDGALLARDIAGLISHLGEERATVVGHDWGGGVAWLFAMLHPDRLNRLAILNCPHPERMLEGLRTPRQLLRSWYMFFFQIPWLPEALIRMGGYAALRSVFRRDPRRPFAEADIARHVAAMAEPGALTAAINYYRALFQRTPRHQRKLFRPIEQPVLVIWGERDRYLRKALAEPKAAWVPRCRTVYLPDATHWVQHDEPEAVNRLLIEHLMNEHPAD
jgi:pimeloyl-ACP methyl ester carboxylesterase